MEENSYEGSQSFRNQITCSEQAVVKSVVLSRVESVNIIRPCGDGPNCIFCQAKHCVEVVIKSLAQKNEVKRWQKPTRDKKGYNVIIKPVWQLLWKLPKWQQLHHSPFSSLALWSEDLKKKTTDFKGINLCFSSGKMWKTDPSLC